MGKGKTSGMISLVGKTKPKMKSLGHNLIASKSYKPTGKTMQQIVNELTRANKNAKS
jgi:hypothetical protein